MNPWTPPKTFDGYRVLRIIGRGGMGEVHLARDSLLDRLVAVKFISGAEPEPKARERFLIEARAIARLQHDNVVSIYRVGQVEGIPYLVSEYVEGKSLDRLQRPMPWRKVLPIGMGIARALAAAHRRGVLHRDIKPANVIAAPNGHVKLLDFGIAKLLDDAAPGPDSLRPVPSVHASRRPCSLSPPTELPTISVRIPDANISSASAPSERPTGSLPCVAASVHIESMPPSLTEIGYTVGTPAYMAPEVVRGAPATFRSDVYALGVLLYELCANRLPAPREHGRADDSDSPGAAAPLAKVAPTVDEAFAAVVDRCLQPDPMLRYASGNEVRAALAQLTPEARVEAVPEGNPYPGLRAFDQTRAALYFGRDSEVRAVLERLSSDGFVLVAGDSGVGKSSLCRAGVLPRLQRWFGSGRVWSTATLVPGRNPCAALAAAIAPIVGQDVAEIERIISDDPGGLGRMVLERLGDTEGVVIFVDQLEELVTVCDPAAAAAFASALQWLAAAEASVRVLATARSDFLGHLAALPALGDSIAPALYFLRPLTPERIREAIVAPARAKGVRFESTAMIDELVASVADAEGGLPLLQFALAELWEANPTRSPVISSDTFRAVGGARGALARHADQVIASMRHELRDAAKGLLRNLVSGKSTRIRCTGAELGIDDPISHEALEALVKARLVVACDASGGTAYEIAHEALIRSWGMLVQILASDVEARVVRERLLVAVDEWDRLGRKRGALWRAEQLRDVQFLHEVPLSERERAFLRASRRQRCLRWGALAAGTVGVAVTILATHGAAVRAQQARMDESIDAALARADRSVVEAKAQGRAATDAEQAAFDKFDGRAEDAETAWELAQQRRRTVTPALDEAERHLESAILLDGSREDVRKRFSHLLLLRAEEAERRDDTVGRDRALERASLYDPTSEAVRAWQEPVPVSLQTDPPGASVAIERWSEADGFTPWHGSREDNGSLTLPQGSFRAVVGLEGHRTTRLPFEVRRGQALSLRVTLMRNEEVPAGLVYVPAGWGWYGSGAEDSLRSGFFNAEPMHQVHVEPFFIAQHETTFSQWLDFMRALPKHERTALLPRVDSGGFNGSLRVVERTDGSFELFLRVGRETHSAREGQVLTLPKRPMRGTLNWLSLPVTGISAVDAVAYAAWLNRSGRVPGARLCTEHEWERAARGADRRVYPHGDQLSPSDANIDETYGKLPEAMAPDEIGQHSASRSPFGLEDMAGNAWEWTVDARQPGTFVGRGGSFFYDSQVARIENRETPEASFRDVSVGLRICADAPRRTSPMRRISVRDRRDDGPS